MTGYAPTVSIVLDNTVYKPGSLAIATATIGDPDNVTETLTAVDGLGRQVVETIVRTDRADVLWRWQGGATIVSGVNPLTFLVPTAPMALECVVSDGQGNQTVASVDVQVVVPPTLRVGVCCPAGERAAHAKLFPGAAWMSSYSPPGTGLPTWKALSTIPSGTTPWVRFKDPATVDLLVPWLDAIPANLPEVFLTHRHEPKVGQDPAVFKDSWARLRQVVDAHPNGHKVRLVLGVMLYQVRHEGFDVAQWWPTMPDRTPAAHAVAFDAYSSMKDGYEAPESLLKVPLAWRDTLGVPLYIAELGSQRVSSDTDGSARAKWASDCVSYLAANGVAGACWFCGVDGGTHASYHLEPGPEVGAWARAIAAAA